jgi:hypothetical protein
MGIEGKAQYTADTVNYSPSSIFYLPFGLNYQTFDNYYIYSPHQLIEKGIVPGDTIYGIAFYKKNNGYIMPNINAIFGLKYKVGNTDSSINVSLVSNPINNTLYYSPQYFFLNYLMGGFVGSMQYVNGVNLNVPTTPAWLQFILDQPFIYTGGSFELLSEWNAPVANNLVGYPEIQGNANPFFSMQTSYSTYYNGTGWTQSGAPSQASIVIYHSSNPQLCNGMPAGGSISGTQYVCVGKQFNLFLVNPSAGPGISYQWQQAPIGSSSWSTIAGATHSMLKDSIMVPTQFRCKTTCNNSIQSAYTNPFPLFPFKVKIDSVTHSVSGNVLSVHAYHNDTATTYQIISWDFGDNTTGNTSGIIAQKTYYTDGTYLVTAYAHSDCSSDTFSFSVTIGCAGSSTFINHISISKDTTCLGKAVKLQIDDTLPSN